MKPIKEFWEWCGFRQLKPGQGGYHYRHTHKEWNWLPPDETERHKSIHFLPSIGLNNLFQYAVPRALVILTKQGYVPPIMKLFQLWYDELVTQTGDSSNVQDAAEALFWALDKVRQEVKNG